MLRNVCFTINNPIEDDKTWVNTVACRYIVVGEEVGEGGTPHLQGYVEFMNPIRFSTLKNQSPRGHFERRMGTAKQAADYCKKDGHFTERGVMSKQGKRSDLDDVAQEIITGVAMREIAEAHPKTFIQYHKGLKALAYELSEDRSEPPRVVWLWGATGSGKTRQACDCPSFYIKDNTQWWDGYNRQSRIVIDDFDITKWNFREFLRLLDRYPFQGQTKGGYVKINSPEIYITCEFSPEFTFNESHALAQVARRVSDVTEVVGNTRATTSVPSVAP